MAVIIHKNTILFFDPWTNGRKVIGVILPPFCKAPLELVIIIDIHGIRITAGPNGLRNRRQKSTPTINDQTTATTIT